MTGKTHVICSTTTMALIAATHLSGINVFGTEVLPAISVISTVVGALAPDVDISQSRLGSKFKFLSKNLKHRGITHTLLMPAILLLGTVLMDDVWSGLVIAALVSVVLSTLYDPPLRFELKSLACIAVMVAIPLIIPFDYVDVALIALISFAVSRSILQTILIAGVTLFAPDAVTCACVAGVLSFLLLSSESLPKVGIISFLILAWCTYAFESTSSSILFGLCVGWTLHIVEDLFNFKGCPILFPFTKKKFHIASFKTRHWSEYLFLALWEGGWFVWFMLTKVGLFTRI